MQSVINLMAALDDDFRPYMKWREIRQREMGRIPDGVE